MQYLNQEVNGDCPVCESKAGLLNYEVNSLQATRHFRLEKPDFSKYLKLKKRIELLWGQENCQIVRCKECEFTYSFPYVGGDEEFYTLAYERGAYPSWKYEFQKSFETIQTLIRGKYSPKVLEIGAGDGAFLSKISPKFVKPDNVYATEYSDYGLKVLNSYGFHTFDEDFRKNLQVKFPIFFDFVFMFQVLEHLDDIRQTFQTLSAITKPEAYVFIGVPNSKIIEFNELNGALLDMPPNHIGRWTKRTFQIVSDRYNWELFDYEIENPNLESTIHQFGTYKYLKNQQVKSSIENLIETYNNRFINNSFFSIKKLILKFYRATIRKKIKEELKDLGATQWVVLKKRTTT